MKALLVYPEYPETFWSLRHALKFISRKAVFPPLGLLTVASMLPESWEIKLIDMNVEKLKDRDLVESDLVFISAMSVQKNSADEVIKKCNKLNVKVAVGGPLFTSSPELFAAADYLILNEAEITLPEFLHDLSEGQPHRVYQTDGWADVTQTPIPRWDLAKLDMYSSMNIQYSRGCPYDCDFCDITVLYGRRPRTKTKSQIIKELDSLYIAGWRGPAFFVDDNFIGNKKKLKEDILPAVKNWMESHKSPFWFNTEATINLADDEELMKLMVQCGFESVFIGIETPIEESLTECNKFQNKNRDLLASVKEIQKAGMDVQGGFIVGFDNDPPSVFERLISFIQESGIVTAMVGILNAPTGTKLYKRLLKENRLISDFNGDNTGPVINFIPKMNPEILKKGFRKILDTIYSPKNYYERIFKFLKNYEPGRKNVFHFNFRYLKALGKSMVQLGFIGRERIYYWKLFFWTLFMKPRLFSLAILFSIYGFHYRKIYEIKS